MPIVINTDDEAGLLVCCLTGMTQYDQFMASLREILRLREETGFNQILVDATTRKESLGMMELLEIGRVLADDFCGARLAVFSSARQPGIEFARSVTTQKEKGGLDMRTFQDEQSARAWLGTQDNLQANNH